MYKLTNFLFYKIGIDDESTLPTPTSSAEWVKHKLVRNLRDFDRFWMDSMRQLENVMTDHVLYIESMLIRYQFKTIFSI